MCLNPFISVSFYLSIIFYLCVFLLLSLLCFSVPSPSLDYFSLFLKSVYISLSGCVEGLCRLGTNEEKGLIAEAPGASWRLGELGRRVLPAGQSSGCTGR